MGCPPPGALGDNLGPVSGRRRRCGTVPLPEGAVPGLRGGCRVWMYWWLQWRHCSSSTSRRVDLVHVPSCSVRLLRGCAMATEVSCGAQCGLLQPLPWYTWLTFVNPGSWGTTSPADDEKVVASYGDEDGFHYAQVVHHAGVDLSLLLSHCCFPQVRCLSGAGCFGGRRP